MTTEASWTPRAFSHTPVRPDWLDLRREDIIEPERPIIDAHHHVWDRAGEAYLADELLADFETGHNICGSVFIQCGFSFHTDGPPELRPVGETARIARIAAEHRARFPGKPGICQGIVGYADLRLGDRAAAVLEAHVAAGQGRFKGIRQSTALDPAIVSTMSANPPPGLMADRSFRQGFRRLVDLGLVFDAWLFYPQLHELEDLARAFPYAAIMLDHMGGPIGIGPHADDPAQTFRIWRDGVLRVAKFANIHVKLGGMGRPVVGSGFDKATLPPSSEQLAQAWRPYVETIVEAFGPSRCVFESNFPVDKGQCSYPVLWNAFKRLAESYSEAEKAGLFHDNAVRFYGLKIGGAS